MKKTLTTIIGVVAILLAITACQPKYVIFPFPGGTNTPSGNADNEITTFAALKDALENGADGKYVLKNVPIDPNTDSLLPIRVNGNKEFSGTANITDTTASSGATANSIMLFADNAEEKLVIFEIQDTATVKFTDFTATVASTVADKVEAVISVDAGEITANNVSITAEGTPVTGIALGANATADKVSIVNSEETKIVIDDNNENALDITTSISKDNPDSQLDITTKYDSSTTTALMENLSTYGKARLTADITETSKVDTEATSENYWFFSSLPAEGKYVIDLNNHKLDITTNYSVKIPRQSTMTFVNGEISLHLVDGEITNSNIVITEKATLNLDNVNITGNCAGIGPNKDSSLNIYNESEVTGVSYAIATNASTDPSTGDLLDGNVSISISENSKVTASEGMAICFNVTGTLSIEKSYIKGEWTAVMARGGNATIENSILVASCDYNGENPYETGGWGQGNCVPFATLVVGNNSEPYKYPTICNVLNTEITMIGDRENYYEVYIASSNGSDCSVNVTLPEKYATGIMKDNSYHLRNPETDVLILNGTQITSNPSI